MQLQFHRINPDASIAIFTWDDNSDSHASIIAPVFMEYGMRCTFYINPGVPSFSSRLAPMYRELSDEGFEIGSHGDVHQHLSSLSGTEYVQQLKKSQSTIEQYLKKRPTTFAFPHHDFDISMLSQARNVYFETRNSLFHSKRFSLKTATLLEEIEETLDEVLQHKENMLVFSGHGAFEGAFEFDRFGYEPVSASKIRAILNMICNRHGVQVCTLEQAALRSYLLLHGTQCGNIVEIDSIQADLLCQYGLTYERMLQIL